MAASFASSVRGYSISISPPRSFEHRRRSRRRVLVAGVVAADDLARFEVEAVAVELERALEVADRERDHIDVLLHLRLSGGARRVFPRAAVYFLDKAKRRMACQRSDRARIARETYGAYESGDPRNVKKHRMSSGDARRRLWTLCALAIIASANGATPGP
jgi:hypothetical protein